MAPGIINQPMEMGVTMTFKSVVSKVLVIVAAFAITACSASVEDQQKKWTEFDKTYQDVSQKWPNLKTALDLNEEEAKKLWKTAETQSDSDKKIEGMKQAIEKRDAVLGKFRQVKDRLVSIRDKVQKVGKKKVPLSMVNRGTELIKKTNLELTTLESALTAAKPQSVEEITTLGKDSVSKLISLSGNLDRYLRQVRKMKKSKRKKKKKHS